jgi:hypothetical protein
MSKSAQQEPDAIANPPSDAPADAEPETKRKKRKSSEQESPEPKKAKKSKAAKTSTETPADKPLPTETPSSKRRKAVNFTPDTKPEDGDSIKKLYNSWVAKGKPEVTNGIQSDQSEQVNAEEESKHSGEDTSKSVRSKKEKGIKEKKKKRADNKEENEEEKRVKKPKKEKTKKGSAKLSTPEGQLHPSLTYLQLFHSSRDSWKFNKVHQIHLLKNAFELERVPSEYIDLLYEYIAGLQGGARLALRNSALAVKVRDLEEAKERSSENMADAEKEQDFEDAVARNVAAMEALEPPSRVGFESRVLDDIPEETTRNRMAKRLRVERIVSEMSQESDSAPNRSSGSAVGKGGDAKRTKLSEGPVQPLKRKRKRRTAVMDDSSDSSDSDSSSDSE